MTTGTASRSPLMRWHLTEPARLYLWLTGFVLIAAAVAAGYFTEDMGQWLIGTIAGVLGMVGAGEAVRSSVYSQAGHLRGMIASRGSWAVDAATDPDLPARFTDRRAS